MSSKIRCQAKDPKTCKHHGTPANELSVDVLYKSYLETKKQEVNKTKYIMDSALESNLAWNGKQPSWWKEYVAKAEHDEDIPLTPELLDVVNSPAGPLAVVWQDESQEDGDRQLTLKSGVGVKICYYKSFKTGETLGYVKMAYSNDTSIAKSFGEDEFTNFRWLEKNTGRDLGLAYSEPEGRIYDEQQLTDMRRNIWYKYQSLKGGFKNSNGIFIPGYSMNKSHIPDDKTVQKELAKFRKEAQQKITKSKAYYGVPYVDFSRVEKPLLGKGFGASLYVYTAKRLAKDGMVLRGSSVQSDEAKALWGKFKKKLPKQVSSIQLEIEEHKLTYHILDFRK